ncbi:MAG: metallophosphoesterase family protein [Magnetospirillum sp.]|nr:metallophosphoesterase family protein [Magnetospirillum sp.]
MTTRVCGPCTICCQFFAVPETGKPTGEWCVHCSASGCGVHETRPQSCRNFACFWLMDETFPEDLRPDRCGIVVSFNENHDSVVVHIDPERPDALAESPGSDLLEALLGTFDPVFVVCGQDRMMIRPPRAVG